MIITGKGCEPWIVEASGKKIPWDDRQVVREEFQEIKNMKYEILEHKADLKIRAFGKTKEELFLNMLLGMAESQKPEIKGEEKNKKSKLK